MCKKSLVGCLLLTSALACSDQAQDLDQVSHDSFSTLPSSEEARLPHLSKTADDELLYSWVEEGDSFTSLFYSVYDGETWSAKSKVDEGSDWFVNWADYPTVNDLGGGHLLAHYLQKSGAGTYAYDVKLVGSQDGGSTWGSAFSPHFDGTETEHGFVSILAVGSGEADVIWLDGRNYAEGGSKNMTLRSARVRASGLLEESIELDEKACDCCSTSLISSNGKSTAYYRDRSDAEIRDISRVELNSEDSPLDVSRDGWEIAGCPVNGPKASAYDQGRHAVAWYTAARGDKKVLLKFAEGDGALSQSIRVDSGSPLGRVDIDWFDENSVYVSWLEERSEDQADLLIRMVNLDGNLGEPQLVATVSSARKTGMPQLEIINDHAYLAWSNVDSKKVEVRELTLRTN